MDKSTKLYSYPTTIEEAANILDREKPGWAEKIDLYTFRMDQCPHCVLGQTYGNWERAMNVLFGVDVREQYQGQYLGDSIFGKNANSLEWINEIKKRAEVLTFAEILPGLLAGKKYKQVDNLTGDLEFFGNAIYRTKARCVATICKGTLEGKYREMPNLSVDFATLKHGAKFTFGENGSVFTKISPPIDQYDCCQEGKMFKAASTKVFSLTKQA